MNTYYRYEVGEWRASKVFNHVIKPNGVEIQYFYTVNKADVFNTFCLSGALGSTGLPVRLVFSESWGRGYDVWKGYNNIHEGDIVTQITIHTYDRLSTVEDYTHDVHWQQPIGQTDRVIEGIGCPPHMMALQGVTGMEFVVQPNDIEYIIIQHFISS